MLHFLPVAEEVRVYVLTLEVLQQVVAMALLLTLLR
jgi:hypothetical protein